MSISEFTTVYNPLLQTLIMFLGLLSILLLAYQVKQSSDWNKVNSQHNLYALLPDLKLEKDFWAIAEKYSNGNVNGRLTYENAQKIRENYEEWIIFKTYINSYERICSAINLGVIDELYAYSVLHSKMKDVKLCCYEYFEYVREIKIENYLLK